MAYLLWRYHPLMGFEARPGERGAVTVGDSVTKRRTPMHYSPKRSEMRTFSARAMRSTPSTPMLRWHRSTEEMYVR